MDPDLTTFGAQLRSVRAEVTPDLETFRSRLDRDLARVRAQVNVRVNPDLATLEERIRQVRAQVTPDLEAFRGRLERDLARMRARVKVRAVLDRSDLADRLRRLPLQVVPSLDGFRARLTRDLARVRARVRVRLDPDLAAFRSTLRSRLQAGTANVAAGLVIKRGEIARLRRELANLTPPLSIPASIDANRPEVDRLRDTVSSLAGAGGGAAGRLAGLVGTIAKLGAAAGTVPSVAGLVSGLVQMGPAAAVAAPALLSVAAAKAALTIGTKNVGDALKGDAEALAKLTPTARGFVKQVRSLAPEWKKVQSSVQTALFKDLSSTLKSTATSVLPVLKTGLTGTATALNGMARGVAATAKNLATSGTLGQALKGANAGLKNLSALPSVLVQGLVQVGAAASPAFDRLTKAGGGALQRLSQQMTAAFKSGAMQASIERALALAGQFFTTLGNLGRTLANVFGPAAQAGAGFLGVLSDLAATAAKVTATPQAQATFQALFQTLAAVGHVVSTVLGAALSAVLPLLSTLVGTLAGPLQALAAQLGPVLAKLATALGQALGPVVSALSGALAAILPIVGQLVSQLAVALAPILKTIGETFGQLVTILATALQPILVQLPGILGPILQAFSSLFGIVAPIVGQLLQALAPALKTIGESLGQLLVALSPLIEALGKFLSEALQALMPVIQPIIKLIGELAAMFADNLASLIKNVVVPAINMIVALLNGDFSGAWEAAKQLLSGFLTFLGDVLGNMKDLAARVLAKLVEKFREMGSEAWAAVREWGANIGRSAASAMQDFGRWIVNKLRDVKQWFKDLPGNILGALGDMGHLLARAGADLIRGFMDGIRSMWRSLKNQLSRLTDMLPSWKGPAQRDRTLLTPAGRMVLDGFMDGIEDRIPGLRRQLTGITGSLPDLVGAQAQVSVRTVPAQPAWAADLVGALHQYAGRDVVIKVGETELARATAAGNRQLARR
ncbi:hypothetical protein [Streptomyces sp. NPDC045470]|uniref:hypothetical protein n=1 Tax=Streptomyces sp. NPDC045470 TaxID=3155469 RepID=UPI0034035AE8